MHREYEDLLLLYTTRSLDEPGRQRLEAHLQTCETCRASLKQWRAISTAVRRAANQRADSLPALHLPDLEQEKNTMHPARAFPQRHNYIPVTFAAIAAMLLITVVVLFMRTPGSTLSVFVQPTTADTVEIVMPTHLLRIDRRIDADDVALVSIPVEVAPTNGSTSLEEVIGKFARTDIYCGQPILSNMIADHSPYVPEYHNYAEIDRNEVCDLAPNPDDEWVNVVIARREIQQGETISEDIVELRPYPSQLIPRDALVTIEAVVDRVAITDIFPEQVIIERITVELIPLDIPEGTVMTYIPLENIISTAYRVQEEDRVDLSATLFFIDDAEGWRLVTAETPGARSITIQVARNAYIVQIGASENGEDRMYLALPLEEAMVLNWLVEAQVPITLALMPESANVDRPFAETTPQIVPESSLEVPDGMVAVYVPRTQILAGPVGLLSDRVDIVITLRFVDVDEEFQLLVPTDTPPDTRLVTQVSISNALHIVSDDPDAMAFVVSPEDAVVLTWLVEARIPLILVSPGTWPGDPLNIPTIP